MISKQWSVFVLLVQVVHDVTSFHGLEYVGYRIASNRQWQRKYVGSNEKRYKKLPLERNCRKRRFVNYDLSPITLLLASQDSSTSSESIPEEDSTSSETKNNAQRWKDEAARIRLEAEKMEVQLTLQKLQAIENKINNKAWVAKRSVDEIQQLQQQLQQLQSKLGSSNSQDSKTSTGSTDFQSSLQQSANEKKIDSPSSSSSSDSDKKSRNASFFDSVSSRFLYTNTQNKDEGSKLETSSTIPDNTISSSIARTGNNLLSKIMKIATQQPTVNEETQQQSTTDLANHTSGDSNKPLITSADKIIPEASPQVDALPTLNVDIPGVSVSQEDDVIYIDLAASNYDEENENQDRKDVKKRGLSGFDPTDLKVYLPIAYEIENTMTNATALEKLDAFRSSEVLQKHFQMKIATLLIQPMKDLQEIESLKRKYLVSSSRIEKESIKRRIETLQKQMQNSDDEEQQSIVDNRIYLQDLPPLSDTERQQRIAAVSDLPNVLQSVYKKRLNLEIDETDIELAIELDYYEKQIQLIDQIPSRLAGLSSQDQKYQTLFLEAKQAIESLPKKALEYCANKIGLLPGSDYTAENIIAELCKKQEADDKSKTGTEVENTIDISNLESLFQNGFTLETTVKKGDIALPEYNDISFVDRSRFIEELYPAVARMEGKHPTLDDVNYFINTAIDKRSFMVTTKPERVIGGWYIRGRNLIDGDENSGRVMINKLQKTIETSPNLRDKFQFFYIPDPSPLTDEDFEMEYSPEPLILVTSKQDPTTFYKYSNTLTKSAISFSGLLFTFIVAVGATALHQNDLINSMGASSAGLANLQLQVDSVMETLVSILLIQTAHEIGHRIVAWKNNFQIGLPTLIPSIQFGLLGAITPLKSSPPNLKAMFDFAIAGPLLGMFVSIVLLTIGLDITTHMTVEQLANSPAFPSYIFRGSELGGSITELFLGKGAVTYGEPDTLLPLHPFAIAGIAGLFSNALSLLPLGNTDGGRIAITMFGRRGAYVVQTFTTILLCIIGIFGFDRSSAILFYLLFAQIWQRELEVPAVNEVDELDFSRGVVGIITALFVALVLFPM